MHIAELSSGQTTDALYLISERSVRSHRNKPGQYLQLTLQDRTGTVKAMYWDVPKKVVDEVQSGAVYKVSGKVESYMDSVQVRVLGIELPTEEIDWGLFLPESKRSAEELTADFDALIPTLEDPHYRELVLGLRNNEQMWPRYLASPAATMIHHAYLRGLIEHSLSMCWLCDKLAEQYSEVNRSLLITGAIFHDIGKMYEYDSGPTFQRTTYGELIGHIAIGDNLVVKLAQDIDGMPRDKVWQIRHLILSHHGQMEWGAPVLPKSLEGFLLHYADNIDAKVSTFRIAADKTSEGADWTERVFSLDHRRLYIPQDNTGP